MAERPPSHRSEQTGTPALDRIQNNVRELIAFAKQLLARVVGLEASHGTSAVATIPINDKDVTLTAAQFACGFWRFTGAATAQRHVLVPRGTAAASWSRLVENRVTGGFNIQIENDDGFVSLALNDTQIVVAADGDLTGWL